MFYAVLCFVLLCCVMLCRGIVLCKCTMLCRVVLCYAVLCCVVVFLCYDHRMLFLVPKTKRYVGASRNALKDAYTSGYKGIIVMMVIVESKD